jgi:hypothetical protein
LFFVGRDLVKKLSPKFTQYHLTFDNLCRIFCLLFLSISGGFILPGKRNGWPSVQAETMGRRDATPQQASVCFAFPLPSALLKQRTRVFATDAHPLSPHDRS